MAPIREAGPVASLCSDCVGRAACFFHQLPEYLRASVQSCLQERAFLPGEVLQREGEPVRHLQVVKVGELLCHRRAKSRQEHTVALVGRSQMLGFGAIWQAPSSVTVQASTAGRVCEARVDRLRDSGVITTDFLLALGRHNLQSAETLGDWAMVGRLKSVTDRVGAVLCLLTQVQHSLRVRLPAHVVLASLVGSSREAVVRALKQLEEEGRIVRSERGTYEVHQHLCRFCVAQEPQKSVNSDT